MPPKDLSQLGVYNPNVVDLSKEASEQRSEKQREAEGAAWAKQMKRTFKGIFTHQERIRFAIEGYNRKLREQQDAQG